MFKKRYSVINLLWLLVPMFFAYTRDAHAYVDPGTGSYIIQIAIGTILGASYVFKTAIGRAIQYIRTRYFKKSGK